MKSKLCSVLVVLFIAVLSATAAHADEPDAVVVEETVSEPGAPVDPVTAQLQSEVLRYYRGIGVEPTEAKLKSGFKAASEMLFVEVPLELLSLAIDEAIKRHEKGEDVPFELVVPRFVRALGEDEARAVKGDVSEAVRSPRPRERLGQARHRYDWRSSFYLEVEGHQRDWGIVTAVMLASVGGVAGTAFLGSLAASYDDPTGFIVGLSHLVSLGFLAHFLNTANLTLGAIKGVVAFSPSAEEALRRMHRARIGTGVAALVLAGLGTALLPLSTESNANFEGFVFVPIAVGCGVAALTLLSISSAHWALEVEFKKLAAGGKQRSTRTRPAVRIAVTPMGIVGVF